ncbi:MAG: hypothetical protein AB8B72_02755 [Crocinitomicaceae bacterium]
MQKNSWNLRVREKGLVVLFSLIFLPFFSAGQRDLKSESIFTPIYGLTYKASLPGGDFADRWGFSNAIGAEINFKLKNNLTFGLESQFLFGNTFKEFEIFDNLLNEAGNITSMAGIQSEVLLLLRGGNFTGQLGYVFTNVGKGPNAGLWLNAGLGYQFHKIRIEHSFDEIPQFKDPYKKGYDKLSMGLVSKQFIGYLQQGSKQYFNFYAGFEFAQGFNRNVRTYNFDTEGPEPELRLDLFYGIKVGWMIPIYKRQVQEFYYD